MPRRSFGTAVLILALAMSNLCRAGLPSTVTDEPGFTQNIYLGLGTPLGFPTFDLGYERKISPKQSLRFQLSDIPAKSGWLGDENSTSYLYSLEIDWLHYFSGRGNLKGWFLGPSLRLVDLHTDYTYGRVLPPFGPPSLIVPADSTDDFFFSFDCLGGYQWILFQHLVFSAGLGLGLMAPLNNIQKYKDPELSNQWAYWFSGGTNIEINLGWAF